MQINPGGRLNTKDVVGRDNEIARYWRVLERQGLVISAERRIGKTHIVLKMRDECRSGFLPFYQNLEAVHSTAELIRSIYGTVHQSLSTLPGLRAHIAKWSSLLPDKIGSVDLPTGAGTWQVLLSRAFDDLIGIADDRIILMLWDEFPLMLHNLQRREGDDAAILNYYMTRLSSYYADDERSLALVVLDTMAGQASPTPVPEPLNLCKHRDPSLTDEQLREILTALAEDHYIESTKCAGGAAYDFRWQIVKKWWKERRS